MTVAIRVALVTYAMYHGGVETFLLRLGRCLSEQGMHVDVITTEGRGEWYDLIGAADLGAIHVERRRGTRCVAHAINVGRTLRGGRYDIVFLNHAPYAQAALSMLPDHVRAVPVLHNDAAAIYKVAGLNPRSWNVAVAVSPKVADTFRGLLPGRPVVHIPCGVEVPADTGQRGERTAQSRLRLLSVGRLDHGQKGVLFLPGIVEACLAQGLDVQLDVVGDGPDRAALERLIQETRTADRIALLGMLPPAEAYRRYCHADLLLLPSFFEGLGMAPLEAQAWGCVPVATRLAGITDVTVEEGKTGLLVDRPDAELFADAIASLYRDRPALARMSAAGRARIAENFSVEAMGRRYVELVDRAMGGAYPLPRSRRVQFPVDLSAFPWHEYVPRPALWAGGRIRSLARRLRGHV